MTLMEPAQHLDPRLPTALGSRVGNAVKAWQLACPF